MYVGVYVKVSLLGANGLQTIFRKHASRKKCPDMLHENQSLHDLVSWCPSHLLSLTSNKNPCFFPQSALFSFSEHAHAFRTAVCVPAGKLFLPNPAWSVLSSFNIYQIQWHLGSFHTIKPPIYSGFFSHCGHFSLVTCVSQHWNHP